MMKWEKTKKEKQRKNDSRVDPVPLIPEYRSQERNIVAESRYDVFVKRVLHH